MTFSSLVMWGSRVLLSAEGRKNCGSDTKEEGISCSYDVLVIPKYEGVS
jgi:hypothetical protein